MSAHDRIHPRVTVVEPDGTMAAALEEWLLAAGYHPVRSAELDPGAAVQLVHWPSDLDLSAATTPLVLLCEREGRSLQRLPTAVAEMIELPDSRNIRSILQWSTQLHGVLRRLIGQRPNAGSTAQRIPTERAHEPPALIAIGISTGGPPALQELFMTLSGATLPPIAIVQHIPASFVDALAQRLTQRTAYPVHVAGEGQVLRAGQAVLAPADSHLRLVQKGGGFCVQLTDEPARRGHRPAADVLFESCAALPVRGVAVIMTGMGQDGAEGMLRLRKQGWSTIGQEEGSCAIYGMPRAARQLGAVERELGVVEIGHWLRAFCGSGFESRAPAQPRC